MKNPLIATPPKEESEAKEGREKKTGRGFHDQLGPKTTETELRLGFSSESFDGDQKGGTHMFSTAERLSFQSAFVLKQRNDGFGDKRWFAETGSGFGNPWTQEKAVLQQNHHQSRVGTSPVARAPPIVGWPPVRTFRKNLALQTKVSEMDLALQTKVGEESKANEAMVSPAEAAPNKIDDSMFVKVNMEGYVVGRKIDLKAHESYESLSRALRNMFDNFFSASHFKKCAQKEGDEVVTSERVLIYEDNEGDRMLVGDVPWEMFVSTVKRLYIICGSTAPSLVAGRAMKDQQ